MVFYLYLVVMLAVSCSTGQPSPRDRSEGHSASAEDSLDSLSANKKSSQTSKNTDEKLSSADPSVSPSANNAKPSPDPHPDMPSLKLGKSTWTLPAKKALRFKNRSGRNLQLNRVTATANVASILSEYCVFLDHFAIRQDKAGVGEVGCYVKFPSEPGYGHIEWNQKQGRGLLIKPGSIITIHFNNTATQQTHTFALDVAAATKGVMSYRFPKVDTILRCNGQPGSPAQDIWKNETGKPLYLTGVTVYANQNLLEKPVIDTACIYILNTKQQIRWSDCRDEIATRGSYTLPVQKIMPGEALSGQARNTCNLGSWDWAGYFHLSH